MNRLLHALAAATLLFLPLVARAQSDRLPPTQGVAIWQWDGTEWVPAGTSNPLAITGSFSATLSGFTAATIGTPITATTGGATGTLPAGAVVVASNAGATNTAYCALGGSVTTAAQPIPPGGWFAFTVGASTQLTCITGANTTTVNMVGGTGLPTGSGGGSSSGGGGGAVTIADTADVTQGAIADAAAASGGTGTISAKLRQATALLQSILTALGGSLGVTGTFWQATQPVSATSLPLPTGAATSTKQPALGTAGTPSTDVISVQPPTSNILNGSNSATTTGATTFTGMGAQGAGIKIYATDIHCFRTDAGTTPSYVTLNNSSSTPIALPVGGGMARSFTTPLVIAANTAFQFTPHDALTTVLCSAQGFTGP